jgi:membrane metallo-endopeptidase-like protein 1
VIFISSLTLQRNPFQFDQSDLLLPSAEYYQLGLGHPIMQTYYNLLVNVATLLGADRSRAKREMKELIEFESELASVSSSD